MATVDAVDVLLRLLVTDLRLPAATRVELIVHEGKENWRQRNPTVASKVQNLREGLQHDGQSRRALIKIGQIRERLGRIVDRIGGSDVVSVTSRLYDERGTVHSGHLAIMNLHPEGFGGPDAVAHAITETTGGMAGYLLGSGRHYHFYGKRILPRDEWLVFLSQFLTPCVMVSPRYIGHSLFQGFCSVRLTASIPHKPSVPTLVMEL